jgi:hypothetical protein
VERLAKETVFRIKALANKRTGAMAAGAHYKKGQWSGASSSMRARVIPYSLFVDQGTEPHVITAKNAPYLSLLLAQGRPGRALQVGQPPRQQALQVPGARPWTRRCACGNGADDLVLRDFAE